MKNQTIETELVVIQKKSVLDIYSSSEGLNEYVAQAAKVVESFIPDLSTTTSRKEIASLARKVSTFKVKLDDYGKELTLDWKDKTRVVDGNRKRMRDALDNLRDKAREPLTKWQKAEDERVEKITRRIDGMAAAADTYLLLKESSDLANMQAMLQKLEKTDINTGFGVFKGQAQKARNDSIVKLTKMIAAEEKRIVDDTELVRLQKENAALQQLKEENERNEREQKKIKDATEELRRNNEEAEKRVVEAKLETKRVINEAEEQRKNDVIQARKEHEEAIEKIKTDRIEQEEKKEKATALEIITRLADESHVKTIETNILSCLKKIGFSEDTGVALIVKIRAGEINHVQINY